MLILLVVGSDAGGSWDAAGQDARGSQAAAPCEELPFQVR